MYCKDCGSVLSGDARFCQACGKRIHDSLINDGTRFGGFWIRFAAYVIDFLVLLIPTLLVSFLYKSTVSATDESDQMLIEIIDTLMGFAIYWIYTAVLVASKWQATIGKLLLGLRIVDYAGNRVSFARASARVFSQLLSTLLLSIGYIMIAFTQRKQGLHDKIAGTLVLRSQTPESK